MTAEFIYYILLAGFLLGVAFATVVIILGVVGFDGVQAIIRHRDRRAAVERS